MASDKPSPPRHDPDAVDVIGRRPEFSGPNLPHVAPADDMFAGRHWVKGRVVPLDAAERLRGVSTAEFLSALGADMTVMTRLWTAGKDFDLP